MPDTANLRGGQVFPSVGEQVRYRLMESPKGMKAVDGEIVGVEESATNGW
jgi:hypothetical protein